jgi:hypothetical protein
MIEDRDLNTLKKCWEISQGKAWEPANTKHPFFERMTEAGFLRIVDGRCGFEAIKDALADWTPAGQLAMQYLTTKGN